MKGLTKAGKIGLLFIFILFLAIVLVFSFLTKEDEDKKVYMNLTYSADRIDLDGDFVTYVDLNEDYEEAGYHAYEGNQDVSDSVVVTYFEGDKQVYDIDTSKNGTYTIRYEALINDKAVTNSRVVIVSDNKRPDIKFEGAKEINSLDVYNYDIYEGTSVSDNSGAADLTCSSTLSALPGEYVIRCEAEDEAGNVRKRNRLVKVKPSIEFDYDDDLTITYPEGNYEYKYSLDGGSTWLAAERVTKLNDKGSIVAAVFENGEFLYSSTYYVK